MYKFLVKFSEHEEPLTVFGDSVEVHGREDGGDLLILDYDKSVLAVFRQWLWWSTIHSEDSQGGIPKDSS